MTNVAKVELEDILRRDTHRCGIHSGGCGKRLAIEEANIDHIIPKNFVKNRENYHEFLKDWNCQPTHRGCNTEKGGMVLETPQFQCICHGVYLDEDGNWRIMHKITENGWQEETFRKEGRSYQIAPTEEEPSNAIKMIPRKRWGETGFSLEPGRERGHAFRPTKFYNRFMVNCSELDRTMRWDRLEKETEQFAKHYIADDGAGIQRELEKIEVAKTIAMMIFWNLKTRAESRSNAPRSRQMKILLKAAKNGKSKINQVIKILVARFIEEGPITLEKTPFPLGSLTWDLKKGTMTAHISEEYDPN